MPSKVLAHQSPYFRLFHTMPDIQHLRIFGTAVYPCLRATNSNKLQPRSTLCVFLGYMTGYKGILCYNVLTGKMVISRNVVHDELVYPFQPVITSKSVTCISAGNSSSAPVLVPSVLASPSLPLPTDPDISSPLNHLDTSSTQVSLPVMSEHQFEVLLPPGSRPASPSINSESSSSTPLPAANSHPMQTRSKSGIHTPNPFFDYHCYSTSLPDALEEPTSYRVASYSLEWTKAMQDEIDALHMQGTWDLVPPPVNKNVVGSKWIYKIKRNSDGTVAKYKTRLVAQGFSQEPGFDYLETFSPVVRHSTVRIIFSLAAMHEWKLRQLDIKNAFISSWRFG
ncbi:hypothetical protein L3X38_008848 [Prunus dulcis]|uniref:Reverse transcriptase Ty1/copia-type domain-containing protein n=1 Tax=Prunus dulcis TaxID=3755 RepID=A0AAD5F7I4_PRUDU|nr:hypothetical protein L3X38_008848 [Prunus dulcis]